MKLYKYILKGTNIVVKRASGSKLFHIKSVMETKLSAHRSFLYNVRCILVRRMMMDSKLLTIIIITSVKWV